MDKDEFNFPSVEARCAILVNLLPVINLFCFGEANFLT